MNLNNYNMKTQEKKRDFIRVIPQFTIQPNRVSLIAEETHSKFKKKDKNKQDKYTTRIVTKENAPEE